MENLLLSVMQLAVHYEHLQVVRKWDPNFMVWIVQKKLCAILTHVENYQNHQICSNHLIDRHLTTGDDEDGSRQWWQQSTTLQVGRTWVEAMLMTMGATIMVRRRRKSCRSNEKHRDGNDDNDQQTNETPKYGKKFNC